MAEKYVEKTVTKLLEINTTEKVVTFMKELTDHSENPDCFDENLVYDLVNMYYRAMPVNYHHKEDSYENKVMSWIDCLEFLQDAFSDNENVKNVKVCFEYHTPDNNWMDVILLDSYRITILEFKSGISHDEKTLFDHKKQIREYWIKMKHSNKNVWTKEELSVDRYLIYTNEIMNQYVDQHNSVIKVGVNQFRNDVVDHLVGEMDNEYAQNIMTFETEWDTSTLGAFLALLDGETMSNVYSPEDSVKYCEGIIDGSTYTKGARVNVIFVNGKPGAGKTGVGLTLLSKYLHKELDNREKTESEREEVPQVKYATGNGNLFNLFNQACASTENEGTVKQKISRISQLYSEKDIENIIRENRNWNTYEYKTDADIVIIDEAQRMWSTERFAFQEGFTEVVRNTILRRQISQPFFVLMDLYRRAIDKQKTVTIVFLIGNGQEIWSGEEAGEWQIYNALRMVSNGFADKAATYVYSSNEEIHINEESHYIKGYLENATVVIDDRLYLKNEKRNLDGAITGQVVNDLLSDKHNINRNDKFDIKKYFEVFSCDDLCTEFEKKDKEKRSRLFMNSYTMEGDDRAYYFRNVRWPRGFKKDSNDLFQFFNKDLGYDYTVYAKEFEAQGLEVDEALVIWKDDLLWDVNDKQWKIDISHNKKMKEYYEKLCQYQEQNSSVVIRCLQCKISDSEMEAERELHPDMSEMELKHSIAIRKNLEKTLINTYRVLLTRARKKTKIFVKDSATREHIKEYLRQYDSCVQE